MTRAYVFKNKFKEAAVIFFDVVGRFFYHRPTIKLTDHPRKIAVIRLDQIGDIVLSLPAIEYLCQTYPRSKMVLITTQAGFQICSKAAHIHEIRIADSPWFESKRSLLNQWKAFWSLVRLIKELQSDLIIDLRGDLRHILAARFAICPNYLISQGHSGGGFLLDKDICVTPSKHTAEQNIEVVRAIREQMNTTFVPIIQWQPTSNYCEEPLPQSVMELIHSNASHVIALHLSSHAPSKLWPIQHWLQLICELNQSLVDPLWICIGDKHASKLCFDLKQKIQASPFNQPSNKWNVRIVCDQIKLNQLGTFFKKINLLITTDSGPAHIAALSQTPTVVIFSGANKKNQWQPLNKNIKVIDKAVACSPCLSRICRQAQHWCMEQVEPSQVAAASLELLRVGKDFSRHA